MPRSLINNDATSVMVEYSSMLYWQITAFVCFILCPLKTHGVSNSSLRAFFFQDAACRALHPVLCWVYRSHIKLPLLWLSSCWGNVDALSPACDILVDAWSPVKANVFFVSCPVNLGWKLGHRCQMWAICVCGPSEKRNLNHLCWGLLTCMLFYRFESPPEFKPLVLLPLLGFTYFTGLWVTQVIFTSNYLSSLTQSLSCVRPVTCVE